MPRKKREVPARPPPVVVGPYRGYARRGPKPGAVWYWQVGYHQRRKLVPLKGLGGWRTREEVERVLAAHLAEEGEPLEEEGTPSEVTTVDELLRSWTAHQKKRLGRGLIKPQTYQSYKATGLQLSGMVGLLRLQRVKSSTLQHIADEVIADGRSVTTAGQMARIFRMVWRWGAAAGHCSPRDWGKLELPEHQRTYRDYTPTAAEAEAIVDRLTEWRGLCAELLWATGGRIGEVGGLTWERVDLVNGQVELVGKTGRRWVPISEQVVCVLDEWRGSPLYRGGTYVLGVKPSSSRRAGREAIIKACQELGIKETTPHGFRRLAATELIGAGVDEKTYESLMGHSWAMGLKIYAQARATSVRAAAACLGRRSGDNVVEVDFQTGQPVEGARTAQG